MKELEDRILKGGAIQPGGIVNVGSFLNQQIDTVLIGHMAQEIKRLYEGEKITKVLTVEASGIAFGYAIASLLEVPLVFVKKSQTLNQSGKLLTATIHSYTHNNTYIATVSSDYIKAEDRILIADDFLATGECLNGMFEICKKADSTIVGCAIAVEKYNQGGGKAVREKGIRLESLAIIDSMEPGNITFKSL